MSFLWIAGRNLVVITARFRLLQIHFLPLMNADSHRLFDEKEPFLNNIQIISGNPCQAVA